MATLEVALRAARDRLAATSDSADLDARLLVQHVLDVDPVYLIVHARDALDAELGRRLDALVNRRAAGEPIAYITGSVGFWTLDLAVDPRVLIPRPDTETLVETALARLDARCALRVADLGTGSGAIALALARERPDWQLLATDASAAALVCAQANATRLGLANVAFSHGRWFEALPPGARFDAVVSNPPYVEPGDHHLAAAELSHEPREALVAGQRGLADLAAIVQDAPGHLHRDGWLLLEHGADQHTAVQALMDDAGFEGVETVTDLGGRPRITLGRSPGGPRDPSQGFRRN